MINYGLRWLPLITGTRIFTTTSGSCFQSTTKVVPGNGLSIAGVSGTIPILKGMTPNFFISFAGTEGSSWGRPVNITMAIFFPALLGAVAKSFPAVAIAGPTRRPGTPLYLCCKKDPMISKSKIGQAPFNYLMQ